MQKSEKEAVVVLFLFILLLITVFLAVELDFLPPAKTRFQQTKPSNLEPPHRPPNRQEAEEERREEFPWFPKQIQPVPIRSAQAVRFLTDFYFEKWYKKTTKQVLLAQLYGAKWPGVREMQILVAVVLVAFLLASGGALADENEYLIVPAAEKGRFGSWSLGAPEADMLIAFAKAFGSNFKSGKPDSLPRSGRYYLWPTGLQFISCHSRSQKPVVSITAFRRGDRDTDAELKKFRTGKEVGIGSPAVTVKTAYGEPTRVLQWPGNPNTVWAYRTIGLYIEISPSGTVDALGVYDPSALNDC